MSNKPIDVTELAHRIAGDYVYTDKGGFERVAKPLNSFEALKAIESYAAERVKEAVAGHTETIAELEQQAKEARDFAGIQGESVRDTMRHYGVRRANEALAKPIETCEWVDDGEGCHVSQCGKYFEFTEGGAVDNDFKFCPHCGKPLVEIKYTEDDDAAEEATR